MPLVALDRNPVLLSKAMPDEFVCAYDEDDNGLDDAIEKQLAPNGVKFRILTLLPDADVARVSDVGETVEVLPFEGWLV